MSSLVSCKGTIVWKYNSGNDDSFLGLSSVTEALGVGKVHLANFNVNTTGPNGEFSWNEVLNPREEEVEGEVLVILPEEVSVIREYVEKHTPKITLWMKLTNKTPETNSLLSMLSNTLSHLSESEANEVQFVF